jgi:nucleotide-binding universal stress UspA family protein
MQSGFNTILIPVDFTINTETAIKKALEVVDIKDASIHLLHVLTQNNSLTDRAQSNDWMNHTNALEKLNQWKQVIEEIVPGVKVIYWLQYGPVQAAIEKKAAELDADLIVIGKQNAHYWFPFLNTVMPSDLETISGTAVLTVRPGALHHTIKTVVVPVSETVPHHKMEVITALCKRTNIKIHLVTFAAGTEMIDKAAATPLLKVYQWLKNALHCPVEYALLEGQNKAKAVLAYAEKIDADILLLHSKTETTIGWPNKQLPDVLPSYSKMQVITVQP